MINACVVGLGGRGRSLTRNVLLNNADINIVAVCDLYEDRVQMTLDLVKEKGGEAKGYLDYKEAISNEKLDNIAQITLHNRALLEEQRKLMEMSSKNS